MKYVVVKILVGAITVNVYVSNKYIIEFIPLHHSTKPMSIIYRKEGIGYVLNHNSFKYEKQNSFNLPKTNPWGEKLKERLVSIEELNNDSLGDYLRVVVKIPSRIDPQIENEMVYEYISQEHPILSPYLMIDGKPDLRILDSNHHELADEYPFLYRKYITNEYGEKGLICEVVDIRASQYSQSEIAQIETWVALIESPK